jgi:hypothetical protein
VRQRGDHAVEHHRDAPAQQVGKRRLGALVWNVHRFDAGARLEQLQREMAGAAVARRRPRQIAPFLLRQRDEFLKRLRRSFGIDDQHDVRLGHQRHRCEVACRIPGHAGEQERVDDLLHGAHEQRVAVLRRLDHELGPDVAAGPGPVLDDHRLAPALLQLLGEKSRDDVGGTAGRLAQHEAHGLVGIVLGLRLRMHVRNQCQRANQRARHASHHRHRCLR